jgi:hypothetical protein
LHLILRRSAVAGDRFLYPRGIVADDGQIVLPRRQENDTASMSHQDRRPWMSVVGVELLNHDDLWPKLLYNIADPIVNGLDTLAQRSGRSAFAASDDSRFANDRLNLPNFQDGIAGDAKARIHAKNPVAQFSLIGVGHAWG